MNISSFDDLLQAARTQSAPQRLLFVFVTVELPPDSTPAQRENFLAGQGGSLEPVMSLDRTAQELQSFAKLVEESTQFGHDWRLVFVAALAGSAGLMPTSEAAEKPLQAMVAAIRTGNFGNYIPFDRDGFAVQLGH